MARTALQSSVHGASRAGDVFVDLARAEPADGGTVVVDLAQVDSTAARGVHPWAADRHSPDRIGRALTTDMIDAREGPTS